LKCHRRRNKADPDCRARAFFAAEGPSSCRFLRKSSGASGRQGKRHEASLVGGSRGCCRDWPLTARRHGVEFGCSACNFGHGEGEDRGEQEAALRADHGKSGRIDDVRPRPNKHQEHYDDGCLAHPQQRSDSTWTQHYGLLQPGAEGKYKFVYGIVGYKSTLTVTVVS
jgi:hypothetical protein